ncbi:MarR family winged helix-turn-helix transcriptional regulator [Jatrophihabitans fulvus]
MTDPQTRPHADSQTGSQAGSQAGSQTQWLSSQEQRAWRALLASTKTLFDALDRQLQRDNDLPHAYYEVLVRLSEAPDRALRMSDLADMTLSSRSRVSHAVARLEERGWVSRARATADGRGQVATLTDAGFAVLEAAAPGHVATVRRLVVDALSAEQVEQLADIGEAIVARIRADEGALG